MSESAESWADLLRGCRRRGTTAPVLAVGDGGRRAAGGVPDHPGAALLVPCSGQCPCCTVEIGAPSCVGRAQGDLQRRGRLPCASPDQGIGIDYGAKDPKAVAKMVDNADRWTLTSTGGQAITAKLRGDIQPAAGRGNFEM